MKWIEESYKNILTNIGKKKKKTYNVEIGVSKEENEHKETIIDKHYNLREHSYNFKKINEILKEYNMLLRILPQKTYSNKHKTGSCHPVANWVVKQCSSRNHVSENLEVGSK